VVVLGAVEEVVVVVVVLMVATEVTVSGSIINRDIEWCSRDIEILLVEV
jgi:hypothetical protein